MAGINQFEINGILYQIEGQAESVGLRTSAGSAEINPKTLTSAGNLPAPVPGAAFPILWAGGNSVENLRVKFAGEAAEYPVVTATAAKAPEMEKNTLNYAVFANGTVQIVNPPTGVSAPEVSIDSDPVTGETRIHIQTDVPEANLEIPTDAVDLNAVVPAGITAQPNIQSVLDALAALVGKANELTGGGL